MGKTDSLIMRMLVYNIAYGTVPPKSNPQYLLTSYRFFRSPRRHFQRILDFVAAAAPDILGLVEVDTGSLLRTRRRNQAAALAGLLDHQMHYAPKYGKRQLPRLVPILRHQTNAILAREQFTQSAHRYLPRGFKRLVLEADIGPVRVYLVHLPLRRNARRIQLQSLKTMVRECPRPCILAGDFNVLGGVRELDDLLESTGLANANRHHVPTFPAWAPKRELDFFLCSPEICVKRFEVLVDVRLSDHLPLLIDFEVR